MLPYGTLHCAINVFSDIILLFSALPKNLQFQYRDHPINKLNANSVLEEQGEEFSCVDTDMAQVVQSNSVFSPTPVPLYEGSGWLSGTKKDGK